MKINRITLENFRNYQAATMDLGERTLLLGANGSGKSTVPDAILWTLTGRCRGVDGKGQGQKDLIRLGAESARVELDLGAWKTARTISRSGSATSTMKTEQILGKLKTTEGMLTAVVYGQTFFDLHHAEAKALLMNALNVQVAKADLPGVDLGSAEFVSLADLESLYQSAFANRAAAKRHLAGLPQAIRPKVVDIKAGQSSEDLQADIRRHQDTMQALTQAKADADAALATRQAAVDAAERAVNAVAQLTGAKAAHENMLAEDQGRLQNAKADLAAAEDLKAEPVDQLAVQARELEVLIEKLGSHDPDRGCVLSASIPCLTKGAEFAAQVTGLQVKVKALADRMKAGQARHSAIVAATQAVKEAERSVAYDQGQIADTERKLAQAQAAQADTKALEKALPGLRKAAKKAAQDVVDHRLTMDKTMAAWQAVVQHQGAQEAFEQAQLARQAAEAEVERQEALVALLGPGGVRLQALDAALASFNAQISEALAPFGFSLAISADPWEVIVDLGSGEGIRFEMLSKGQRLFTGLAFQLALAKVSGLGFVVVDDVEAVVGQARRLLTGAVMTSDLEQILVAMAKPDDEAAPVLAGLQVIRVSESNSAAA